LEGVAEGLGGGDGGGRGDVQFNEEDEKSLEELLGELGGRGQWDLKGEEQRDIGSLVRDARRLLPVVQKSIDEGRQRGREGRGGQEGGGGGREEGLTDWENVEVDIGSGGVNVGRDDQGNTDDDDGGEEEENKKHTEEQETDDIIARVMAELAISKKYGDLEEPPDQDENKTEDKEEEQDAEPNEGKSNPAPPDDALSLPSAPSTLPQDDLATTQAIEDALTARLAALSKPQPSSSSDPLGLPSAPSFAPANKPPKIIGSNLPAYTDEEIDTWCIICTDDATLKCLGCDDDLYCQNCWMEGHRGESAGYEERRHKAVLFSKKKGEKKKVAAAG
jgi:hypothetical protein